MPSTRLLGIAFLPAATGCSATLTAQAGGLTRVAYVDVIAYGE